MARTWFNRLPILITRPFNYIGRGQNANFLCQSLSITSGVERRWFNWGNLDVEREFLDVRSVAVASAFGCFSKRRLQAKC